MNQELNILKADYFSDINIFENLYKFKKNNSIDKVSSNYYFYWIKKKIKSNKFRVIIKLYNKIFIQFLYYNFNLSRIYKKELITKNNIKFLTEASFQDFTFLNKKRFL